ncbi:MAG: HAD family phosphatase [Candidatus Micrarchaeota archaeon]
MIKAILFDLGGTYMRGSSIIFVQKACKVLEIPFSRFSVDNMVFDSAYNKGEITIQEFFHRYFSVPISGPQMKQLIGLWTTSWKPEPEMIGLVNRLKKKYRLGMLSNSDPVNFPNYAKKGWIRPFEVLVLSHELGMLKPEKEIYLHAIRKTGFDAKEILFIDDQKPCLKTAEELGMKTILFRSLKQLKKDLAKLGIDC